MRETYQKLAQEKGNEVVWNKLNEINPELASSVHPNNLKRVIRYIEIATNKQELTKEESILKNYNVLAIGITADRDEIYQKINKRVDIMLEMDIIL